MFQHVAFHDLLYFHSMICLSVYILSSRYTFLHCRNLYISVHSYLGYLSLFWFAFYAYIGLYNPCPFHPSISLFLRNHLGRCMPSSSADESDDSMDESEKEEKTAEAVKPESSLDKKDDSERRRSRRRRRRRAESHHDDDRDRGRRRRRESHKTPVPERAKTPVPEPAHPPRAKTEEPQQKSGQDGNKGYGKRQKSWHCKECGQAIAPYPAAMEQHMHLNEYCLASQCWNRLKKWEQDLPGSWFRCKREARGMKYGRRTEVAEERFPEATDEERELSPALSLRSAAGAGSARDRKAGRSEMISRLGNLATEKKSQKESRKSPQPKPEKKKKKKQETSSEKPKKKTKKGDPDSSDLSDGKPQATGKHASRVVINFH